MYKVTTTEPNRVQQRGVKLTSNITTMTSPVTFSVGGGGTGNLAVGQVIQIDNEALTITALPSGSTVTATRERLRHDPVTLGVPIYLVTAAGTPAPPIVTLADGVYIMAGGGFSVCGAAQLVAPHVLIYNTDDSPEAAPAGYAQAETLASNLNQTDSSSTFTTSGGGPGGSIQVGETLVIGSERDMIVTAVSAVAGGGGGPGGPPGGGADQQVTASRAANGTTEAQHFSGATIDEMTVTGNGALGQIDLDTSGTVRLGPMTTGDYAGMTIFRDRPHSDPNDACDGKSGNPNEWDIAFQSMGSAGPISGALGSVSGTIYASAFQSDFGHSVSGVANLAIITSCIYINGATSTFNFIPGPGSKLFGIGESPSRAEICPVHAPRPSTARRAPPKGTFPSPRQVARPDAFSDRGDACRSRPWGPCCCSGRSGGLRL